MHTYVDGISTKANPNIPNSLSFWFSSTLVCLHSYNYILCFALCLCSTCRYIIIIIIMHVSVFCVQLLTPARDINSSSSRNKKNSNHKLQLALTLTLALSLSLCGAHFGVRFASLFSFALSSNIAIVVGLTATILPAAADSRQPTLSHIRRTVRLFVIYFSYLPLAQATVLSNASQTQHNARGRQTKAGPAKANLLLCCLSAARLLLLLLLLLLMSLCGWLLPA